MSAKIRLTRFGKKGAACYRIVVAHSASPREGEYIELIGTYNPSINDSSRVTLNKEKAKFWLKQGAVPTDTVREIFSGNDIFEVIEKKEKAKKKTRKQGKPMAAKLELRKELEKKKKEAGKKAAEKKKAEDAAKAAEEAAKVAEAEAKVAAEAKTPEENKEA